MCGCNGNQSNSTTWTEFIYLVVDYKELFVNFCQNSYSKIEKNSYFHFSFYTSMKFLSCHSVSDKRTLVMAMLNIVFVQANIMNISVKYQLHRLYDFWRDDFWIFFCKLYVLFAMATNQNQVRIKFICDIGDYSRNMSVNILSKYLHLEWKKDLLHFSHYKPMETLLTYQWKQMSNGNKNKFSIKANILGPVAQSIISLTSSLRVISLTALADSIHNILIFFAEKMWVATHIFSAKNFSIFAYHSM